LTTEKGNWSKCDTIEDIHSSSKSCKAVSVAESISDVDDKVGNVELKIEDNNDVNDPPFPAAAVDAPNNPLPLASVAVVDDDVTFTGAPIDGSDCKTGRGANDGTAGAGMIGVGTTATGRATLAFAVDFDDDDDDDDDDVVVVDFFVVAFVVLPFFVLLLLVSSPSVSSSSLLSFSFFLFAFALLLATVVLPLLVALLVVALLPLPDLVVFGLAFSSLSLSVSSLPSLASSCSSLLLLSTFFAVLRVRRTGTGAAAFFFATVDDRALRDVDGSSSLLLSFVSSISEHITNIENEVKANENK
jgi:hypothetical protein